MSTTIEISDYAHAIYKEWKRKTKMSSVVFFDKLVNAVIMRKRQVLYDSLPDPRTIKSKPLSNVKLRY